MPNTRTMVELVDRLRDADPAHGLILVDARGRELEYSWAAFHGKILAHAAWLRTQGIAQGDRIVVCPTNDPDVLASFLALLYLGAVPLSVSGAQLGQAPGSQLPFIAELVKSTGASGVFTQGEIVSGNDERALIAPELLVDLVPSSIDSEEAPPELSPAEVDEDDLAFVQFSSGSTSRPKGVRVTHRNAIGNIRILGEWGERGPEDGIVSWLPLYHDMGLIGGLFSCMWHRTRRLVLMNPIRFLMKPITWLEWITKTKSRVTVCPNFALDLCTDRITEEQLDERGVDLSVLDLFYVGAEPVRPSSVQRFEEKFARWGMQKRVIHPVYGLAEATLIVTAPEYRSEIVTRQVDGIEVPSVGYPLGDFKVRIVTENGADAAADEIGELWLRGTPVTRGYLDESTNGELFEDGWLKTGDLASRDEAGRIYITGRSKDLIIVNGKNYYSHDIVADLERLPFIERGKVHVLSLTIEGKEQIIIMTVPLARMSQQVRQKLEEFERFMSEGGPQGWLRNVQLSALDSWVEALISSDRTELVNEIKRFVLARYGVPVHDVICVPKIPRTSSGKVKRDLCERLCLEQKDTTAP